MTHSTYKHTHTQTNARKHAQKYAQKTSHVTYRRRDIILVKSPFEPTHISNAVVYDLFSQMPEDQGFFSLGVGLVHLTVDSVDFGLYSVIEDLDDNLLEVNGRDPMGIFLKWDEYDFETSVPQNGYPKYGEWLDNKGSI